VLAVVWVEPRQVLRPIEAQQRGHVVVAGSDEQTRRPAERGGRVPGRAERVTDIVLAVAERPLAVLPGLAPVDGGEAEQKATAWKESTEAGDARRRRGQASLEDMVAAQVVIDPRRQIPNAAEEGVALGGVEVTARGVGS
jgi:hypothetical protein